MQKHLYLKWLRINLLFFVTAFIIALGLALLFPNTMLRFVRKWGAHTIATGPTVIESTSNKALFVNILIKNSFMILLFFIASLILLAPLLAIISGVFYSLGLLSAIDHFLKGEIWYPFWVSPVLTAIEVSLILLTLTIGSALGAEIFDVIPERKVIQEFWKKNWKKLAPEQKQNWKNVLGENKRIFAFFAGLIIILLLFGAWFEVWV